MVEKRHFYKILNVLHTGRHFFFRLISSIQKYKEANLGGYFTFQNFHFSKHAMTLDRTAMANRSFFCFTGTWK